MKTRLPQIIGEELPASGNGTRQWTFSSALHLSGRFFSLDTPVPSGPRQAGQLLAAAEKTIKMLSAMREKLVFIICLSSLPIIEDAARRVRRNFVKAL